MHAAQKTFPRYYIWDSMVIDFDFTVSLPPGLSESKLEDNILLLRKSIKLKDQEKPLGLRGREGEQFTYHIMNFAKPPHCKTCSCTMPPAPGQDWITIRLKINSDPRVKIDKEERARLMWLFTNMFTELGCVVK